MGCQVTPRKVLYFVNRLVDIVSIQQKLGTILDLENKTILINEKKTSDDK